VVVFAVCVMTVYVEGHFSDEIIGGLLLGWAVGTAVRALAWPGSRRATPPEVPLAADDGGHLGLTAPAQPI
jgi:membrane-associated phospholipid phosphatase